MIHSLSPDATAFGSLETASPLTDAEIDAKAKTLLTQLTLDEKISIMDGDPSFWAGFAEMMNGGYNAHVWLAGSAPRLGIPGIRFSDGPRGIVMRGATTFPVSMARGASFDPALEERIGDVIGRELRALGGNHFGGVCINLVRHPAWGRAQETYGEDSFLLGEFGAALTRGVQRHVMACAKHYALNSMENARFTVDVTIDERALHEVYLPHFKRCVDAGVASIMSAYNSVNGEWCGQNATLLRDILKTQWGFEGFILTDFIFGMRDAKKAALAGQDLEMPFENLYGRFLKGLVESGEVPVAAVDEAALRLLRQQVRFGQGRNPADYTTEVLACDEHRQLAREAAQKSIVLLKNDGDLLPLHDMRSVAVIGKLADMVNTGDRGSSNTLPSYVITPLQGLQAALGDEVSITYNDGSDPANAASAARDADAVICVVGYTAADEGEFIAPEAFAALSKLFPPPTTEEAALAQALFAQQPEIETSAEGFGVGGDRSLLTLHDRDEALIRAVAAANPRTAVVIIAGSAVITEAWRNDVAAIVMLWYAGMEGGNALADVLLGKVNPGGKLPVTFPRCAEDLPFFDKDATAITYDLWHGYRKLDRDGVAPAFAFGYGLSYTTFALSNLRIAGHALATDGVIDLTVDVTNTGYVAGDEVVQIYITACGSRVERAAKELKAFARVTLAPGETRTLDFNVPVAELAYFEAGNWVIEPIAYDVIAARHAADIDALHAEVRVN